MRKKGGKAGAALSAAIAARGFRSPGLCRVIRRPDSLRCLRELRRRIGPQDGAPAASCSPWHAQRALHSVCSRSQTAAPAAGPLRGQGSSWLALQGRRPHLQARRPRPELGQSRKLCSGTCHTVSGAPRGAQALTAVPGCRAVNTQERPATTTQQVDEVDLNIRCAWPPCSAQSVTQPGPRPGPPLLLAGATRKWSRT